ncbi:PGF-pre-PGF domain-containing protein [Methanolobus sp. ZRKC5]|uniref:PGF-pre-PGF domain-containing protein n=1 Tax=unclassified Methanolobus TaxID=2629569 RepID=UPI00313CAD95
MNIIIFSLNIYRKMMLFFLILTLVYSCILITSANSVVSISPSTQEVYAKQNFDVYINIEPDIPIAGAQLDILFNNNMFSANDVDDEGFFEQGDSMSIFIGGTVDNPQGKINGLFAVTLGQDEISTSGNFAHITFTASNNTGNYIISLSNVILSDSEGKAVPVTIQNSQVKILGASSTLVQETITTSGCGAGGGGGNPGENIENIDIKEVEKLYITGDSEVIYLFDENANPIKFIRYRSLKNAGFITSTIEVLKDVSSTISEKPEGTIYRNINIWLGKAGYATETNMKDMRISFAVLKKWILVNDVETTDIHLKRYHEHKWETLETKMTGENEDFVIFEAITPGFSPFAITADVQFEKTMDETLSNKKNDNDMITQEEDEKEDSLFPKNSISASTDEDSAKLAQNSSLILCMSMFILLLCRRGNVV